MDTIEATTRQNFHQKGLTADVITSANKYNKCQIFRKVHIKYGGIAPPKIICFLWENINGDLIVPYKVHRVGINTCT